RETAPKLRFERADFSAVEQGWPASPVRLPKSPPSRYVAWAQFPALPHRAWPAHRKTIAAEGASDLWWVHSATNKHLDAHNDVPRHPAWLEARWRPALARRSERGSRLERVDP